MIVLKHGKKPEPKRWKFRCENCGCEWIADQDEVDRWSTFFDVDRIIAFHHATCNCPTCDRATSDLCEVKPDEYNKLFEQVEMPHYFIDNTSV